MKRITALLLALVLCFGCVGVLPASAADADDGGTTASDPSPILYLDMEDVTDGKVTNQADGKTYAISGAYEQAESVNGSSALKLDGATTCINVGKEYQVTEEFTAAAWIQFDSSAGDYRRLFSTGRSGKAQDCFDIAVNNSGNVYYYIGNYGSLQISKIHSGAMETNTWQHVAIVGDGTGVEVYVNGVSVGKNETTSLIVNPYLEDLLIGSDWDSSGAAFTKHMFKGLMDEVRLYDKALTAEQVADLATIKEPETELPEPLLYLDMESTENDQVVNRIDGKAYDINGSVKQAESVNGTQALELDGSTTYINIGRDYQVQTAFTASALVNISSGTKDHAKLFGTGRTGVNEPTFSISARRNGWNNICYDFAPNGSAWTEYNTMTFDAWQHLTVTGDAEQITIYLNGEQVYTKTWNETLNIPDYVTDMLVGAGWNNAGDAPFANHMFKGLMDEVRLYDVALTAEQVAELYKQDTTVHEPEPEPVPELPDALLYLDMEEVTNDGKVTNQINEAQHQVYGVFQQGSSLNGSNALEFDGSTTYINVGKDYQVTNAFTASALVKITSGIKERARIFAVGRSGNANDVEFNLNIKESDHAAWYSISGVDYGKTASNTVAFDAWQHVTWVATEKDMTIYVNGKQVYTGAWSNGGTLNLGEYSTDMIIGTGIDGSGNSPFANHTFKGLMDEVRLYDVALTAEQVEALYKQDTTLRDPQEDDPYLKQDGTPAYGVKTAVAEPGKLNWLETTEEMPTTVTVDEKNGTLTMSNGAISRTFALPEVGGTNFYTKSYQNTYINKELMTGESAPEIYLGLYSKAYGEVYDGKTIKEAPEYYYVGGPQAENTFAFEGYEIFDECEKPFDWEPDEKYGDPSVGDWPPPGKRVVFTFGAADGFPEAYQGVKINVIYEMYDNCAAMKKRVEITNESNNMVLVGRLAPDVLPGNENLSELLYTETNYTSGWDCTTPMDDSAQQDKFDALHCLCASESSASPFKKLTNIKHTCYDLGPAYELSNDPSVAPHSTFASFDTYELIYSTYWFEHQSLERLGFYRKVFPWITDNPLTMHNTSALSKEIIDHAAAAGFEMIIQSYGSPDISGQMLSRNESTIQQYKELVDYAHSKGIKVGTYQAQYTLGAYRGDATYGGNAGAVGGGWSAWCMASAAFDDYWDNFKNFVEQTGLDCVEIDGCFAGDACISGDSHVNADRETDPADPTDTTTGDPSKYAFHHGYFDSKVMQWENAVRMLCAEFRDMGVYIKVPAWYYAAGGNKCGIGYDESHWSQSREHQLAYGRKLMYNASYIRTMSMSWSHIPFSSYHGGGSTAAFRPFSENVFDYNWVVAQYLGNGVAADFRGPEIYDETVKPILDHWVNVYQRYRGIINSDMVHITQADSAADSNYTRNTKMDTLYHVNANNDGEKGLLWVYNQTDEKRTEIITVPMYYTGLTTLNYPSYPIPDSMGKEVDHYYGNFTNYEWLPTVRDYELPEVTGESFGSAAFVQEGLSAQVLSIDSNGNAQLEVTLEPMSFTYFAIYAPDEAPVVTAEISAVQNVQAGEVASDHVTLTWDSDVEYKVYEDGKLVEKPAQTITSYEIYRDGVKIGTSLTNSFTDENVKEYETYTYTVRALMGTITGAWSDGLQVTVAGDTTAPTLISARALEADTIVLTFSEAMDKTNAENTANYTLNGNRTITGAALSEDGKQVTLTVTTLELLQEYTLTIRNLTDASRGQNPLGDQTAKIIYGYLAYYPMDGVDGDVLAGQMGGADAEAKGVTYTSATGKDGCAYFNAADKDYAVLEYGMLDELASYTISVEVWPHDVSKEGVQAILSAGQEETAANDLTLALDGGVLKFRTSDANGEAVELTASDDLQANAWNQIVVTRSGNTFCLYLNGKLQATQTNENLSAFHSLNNLYLGTMTNHAGGDRTAYFGGRVDELSLYTSAMTAAQVAAEHLAYQRYASVDPMIYLDFEDVTDGKVTNRADGTTYDFNGTVTTVESGNGSQGLKFDGSTNYINMGNEYQLGGEYTVSAWVRIATTGDNRNHKIFGRGYTTHAEGEFYACIRNLGYNIAATNEDNSGKAELMDFKTPYLTKDEWAHFAVVCDGTTVTAYLNGVPHTTTGNANNLNLAGNMRDLLVGAGWNASGTGLQGDHIFKGEMDEVYLFDAALTQADITALMNQKPEVPSVSSISVNSTTHKTAYFVGDSLDVTNLTIEAVYDNGAKETVYVTEDMVTGFDSTTAGEKTLTITYEGKTTTYTVTVSAAAQQADKTLLQALYNANKDRRQGNYTNASWKVFEAAMANAEAVLNNEAATQAEVNAAEAALREAIAGLTEKPTYPVLPIIPGGSNTSKPAEEMNFTDVSKGDLYYDDILYVYENGIMNGTGSGKFSPNATLTRAMVVTILYRMEGEPAVRYNAMFSDVENYQWYTNGVEWAAKEGIVTGYTTGKFGPNDPVTREQLAAILYRYAQSKNYVLAEGDDLSNVTDASNISPYAVSAVKWSVTENLLDDASGKLLPRENATRAEVAHAIAGFCRNVGK